MMKICYQYAYMFNLAFIYTNMQNNERDLTTLSIEDALNSPFFWSKQEMINFIITTQTYADTEISHNNSTKKSLRTECRRMSFTVFGRKWDTTKNLINDLTSCKSHTYRNLGKSFNSLSISNTSKESFQMNSTAYSDESGTKRTSVYNEYEFDSLLRVLRNTIAHDRHIGWKKIKQDESGMNDCIFDDFSIPHPKMLICYYICVCDIGVINISSYVRKQKFYKVPDFLQR